MRSSFFFTLLSYNLTFNNLLAIEIVTIISPDTWPLTVFKKLDEEALKKKLKKKKTIINSIKKEANLKKLTHKRYNCVANLLKAFKFKSKEEEEWQSA